MGAIDGRTSVPREHDEPGVATASAPPGRTGLVLVSSAVLALAAAGALLWWRQGEAVFAAYVSGALAWCF